MNAKINKIIQSFSEENISDVRKIELNNLMHCIQQKRTASRSIRLNFICTHNSRRSHLAQIWAQTMAFYFNIQQVSCYSGGTERTALFYKVIDTLQQQGFEVSQLSEGVNPVYAVKFDINEPPVIGFSKKYDDGFNPANGFIAIMTCSSADAGCPFVPGAESRFSIKYEDPKMYDVTELMDQKYEERSLEIAREMWYVFSRLV